MSLHRGVEASPIGIDGIVPGELINSQAKEGYAIKLVAEKVSRGSC